MEGTGVSITLIADAEWKYWRVLYGCIFHCKQRLVRYLIYCTLFTPAEHFSLKCLILHIQPQFLRPDLWHFIALKQNLHSRIAKSICIGEMYEICRDWPKMQELYAPLFKRRLLNVPAKQCRPQGTFWVTLTSIW